MVGTCDACKKFFDTSLIWIKIRTDKANDLDISVCELCYEQFKKYIKLWMVMA